MAIKISQVRDKKDELLQSLRKTTSPNKRKLIDAIRAENWLYVIQELLFRIELYSSEKILSYKRSTMNDVVLSRTTMGLGKLAKAVYAKMMLSDQLVSSLNESSKPKKDIEDLTYEENQSLIKRTLAENKHIKSQKEFTDCLKKEVEKLGYDFKEYQDYVRENWGRQSDDDY